MHRTASGITKFSQRLQLIRFQKVYQIKRRMNTFSMLKENINDKTETWRNEEEEEEEDEIKKGEWWVPHPRTGIYFPIGQERVMNDIPNGAASLPQNYWLRSEDGVEKPDPDFPIAYKHH
ncbi:uncharacterized protein LOC129884529 [Solanum dulcamara]|uniref:uncharacterized protein LOC129884529 n=1 Tax=Solanum dulcamara TaxID=45834 RepID=UPI0024863F83|nr:uncharacterized protein LOC129884529 [Solanum dulcamara]